MPKHNRPDIAARLREKFDVDPPGVFDTIGPEIVPVTLVDAPAIQREALGGAAQAAGGAGTFAHVQLLNPSGSGVVLELDWAIPSIDANAELRYAFHGTALTTLSTDIRFADRCLSGSPAGQIRTEANASALGSAFAFHTLLASTPFGIPLRGVVLDEGQGLVINNRTANALVRCNFKWSEREKISGE